MKFSSFITCAAFVLVGALVIAEAGRYNSQYNSNNNGGYNQNSHNNNNNNNNNGYAATNQRQKSNYGPYHSYAVKPAVYGGHGLYQYRGYARQYPKPPVAHYRPVRSYNQRQSSYGHSNNNNNGYAMRPVQAVVLAPASYHGNRAANRYNNNGGHSNYRQKRNNGGYSNGGARYQANNGGHSNRGSQYRANQGYSSGRSNGNRHHAAGRYNKQASSGGY